MSTGGGAGDRHVSTNTSSNHQPDLNTNCCKRKPDNETTEYDESKHEVPSFFVMKGFSTEIINAAMTENIFSVNGPAGGTTRSPANPVHAERFILEEHALAKTGQGTLSTGRDLLDCDIDARVECHAG
jgi:hypothetical protein